MQTKEIVTYVAIDGRECPRFVTLTVRQAFYAHHSFELVLNSDALASGIVGVRATKDFIGRFVHIAFGEHRADEQFFRGIITEASFRQEHGKWAHIVLKGYSTTYLLEGGEHFASYSTTTLRSMVEELAANLAQNDLVLVNKPLFQGEIAYKCQFGESHFDFLCRLAMEYGEWFYSNGRELFFGRPTATGDRAQLVQGRNLYHVKLALKMQANRATHYNYRAEDGTVHESTAANAKVTDELADASLKKAEELYLITMQRPCTITTPEKSDLDTYASQEKGRKRAETILLEAEGDCPQVKIGGLVEINFEEYDLAGKSSQEKAEYLVIQIEHHISGTGAYTHRFEAIPSHNDQIPCNARRPIADTQVGLVKDNADPRGWGRVKVQMPWQQYKGRTTDWIWVLSPDAGSSTEVSKNRGHVFVPEVGDRVMVGFQQGDPDRPFVMGSVFHGKNAAGGGKGNTLKSIVTQSGHTIAFDDTEGSESITITDKKNNSITLDTASGSITISAPENISIVAKNIDLNAKENISFTAGTDISTSAKENISQSAGENLVQHAGKDATLAAKNISSQAQEKASHNAKEMESTAKEVKVNSTQKDMLLSSGKKVNMQSGEKIKLF